MEERVAGLVKEGEIYIFVKSNTKLWTGKKNCTMIGIGLFVIPFAETHILPYISLKLV